MLQSINISSNITLFFPHRNIKYIIIIIIFSCLVDFIFRHDLLTFYSGSLSSCCGELVAALDVVFCV
ncbi:hypothetical protein EB796_013987 [Bugula neritina]|uniref:Uncharacterized protein n=1 Tax=Bugula neritina TaxID=10212 RepID=A0A7J7JP77_BUGNE|nr:hypothetical protein EB796_013987 [Bugula neritina]